MLRALAHPQRLRIVEYLSRASVPVGQVADALDLPPAAVSQHLNNLRANGVLTRERDGRRVLYRVIDPNVLSLMECLRRNNGTPPSSKPVTQPKASHRRRNTK